MARLTAEQQLFIIDELAMWSTPQQTADAFKARFGITIGRDHVAKYNPDGAAARDLSQKLRARFEERRRAFIENIDGIPIANRAYRVQGLQRMYEEAIGSRNRQQAMAILEQAAKETGGSFTNEHKVKHSGRVKGAPAPMTIDQIRSAFADVLGEGLAARHIEQTKKAEEAAKKAANRL